MLARGTSRGSGAADRRRTPTSSSNRPATRSSWRRLDYRRSTTRPSHITLDGPPPCSSCLSRPASPFGRLSRRHAVARSRTRLPPIALGRNARAPRFAAVTSSARGKHPGCVGRRGGRCVGSRAGWSTRFCSVLWPRRAGRLLSALRLRSRRPRRAASQSSSRHRRNPSSSEAHPLSLRAGITASQGFGVYDTEDFRWPSSDYA